MYRRLAGKSISADLVDIIPKERALILERGGQSLHDAILEGAAARGTELMRQLLELLSRLEQYNIVHADIKPQNIAAFGVFLSLCDIMRELFLVSTVIIFVIF